MKDDNSKTTGQLIREARLAKSRRIYADLEAAGQRIAPRERPETIYLQRDLAADCGIAESMISKYMSGSVEPELPTLRKLAAALDVPVAELIGDEK